MEVLNKEKVLEHAKRLIDEGKVDRAVAEYRRLLDIDPKDMRIRLRIAELLVRQKKISEAVKAYKEVADSYTEDGFYLKAVTVYKNVLRLNPSLIDINYKLAELYEKMGLNRDAVHQYQILANALEQKGDAQALVDVREKMVGLDPHNVSNRIRLAEAYQYQGREDESLNEYEELVNEIKGIGKIDQLVELYEKILSYRPDNLDMIRSLTKIYYKRGEWKKVISHLEKKEDLIEGQTDLILMLADVYTRLNQLETAKGKYKDVASIFIEAGELDKALDAYKEILVISPEEEKEVKELVGEIDPDFFEKVKSEAADKKRKLEERQAQLAEEAQEGEGEGKRGAKEGLAGGGAAPAALSEVEIKRKLREADAAFELGKAYYQMGLIKEAEPELEKGLTIYGDLARSGFGDEKVTAKIADIEKWLGRKKGEIKERAAKSDDEETGKLSEAAVEELKKVAEKEAFAGAGKGPQEGAKEKSPKKGKKKKDKRMGFV